MKNQIFSKLVLTFIVSCIYVTDIVAQYAHNINKQRRYDEVSWLITHNAYNSRVDGPGRICFGGGNQDRGIYQQLRDGVRSFMVDIYSVNGKIRLKHGSPNTCMMDGKKFSNIIHDWLNSHPLDIITLHIESGPNIGKRGLDDLFFGRRNGYKNMSRFIYNHKTFVSRNRPGGSGSDVYPTVQEMLDQKKQLVIFTETDYKSDLFRYEFQHTAQNRFRSSQVENLWLADKFETHRGVDHKTILTVNHFAGDRPTFNGDKNKSRNANKDVLNKAITSWYMFGHRPSIAVDYYELSNGRSAMSQINDVNNFNEVRGRFIDPGNPSKHIRDVKTYLAKFENGQWRKVKNNEHRGKRASWHLFYSFPARSNDNRAIFFEHPQYNFSPAFINTGNYDGNNKRTYVVNVNVSRKGGSKSLALNANESQPLLETELLNNSKEVEIVELYDLFGRSIDVSQIQLSKNSNGEFNIQNENQLRGLYILKIISKGKTITKKIVL